MTTKNTILSNPEMTLAELKSEIVSDLQAGKSLLGQGGLLTPLIKSALEASLAGEMESFLDDASINRRNGTQKKTVKHVSGEFELETPRDRNSDFEPKIVKKRQTILNESLDEKILGLYGLGMTYSDIQAHLKEMYDVNISSGTITAVTNKLLALVEEWRNRPLEAIYPVVFLDAMWFKSREDNKVIQKVIYNILGITQDGRKEILGFYAGDTEGAGYWLGVLNRL